MSIIPQPLKQVMIASAKAIVPGYYWNRKLKYLQSTIEEIELHLLPYLCNPAKTSIDIGAAGGLFTAHLLPISDKCIAFEPIPAAAADLKAMFEATKSKVTIEPVALSDKKGEAILRMLEKDLGRSTIEEANVLHDEAGGNTVGFKVPIRTLDEYNFTNVGFIKIDVEGHELSTLHGAKETIQKNLPSFIIEIEDRHKANAVKDATSFLAGFGYQGFFVLNGKITPLSEFNITIHQDPANIGDSTNDYQRTGVYINNFIFIPNDRVEKFIRDTNKLSVK